ncbi:MAG: hypothetical protein D6798_07975 [Deltaproteobacteria bacterium]|nr:MAG: hypothetical protein D6798_07975 [Deltaproteobacteria bacterium]
MPSVTARRLPILVGGMLGLLAGLLAGLGRLGWNMGEAADLAALHGPLMVMVFLGTLIPLERAVALGHPLALLAPALSVVGGAGLVAGLPRWLAGGFLVLGAVGLVVILAILRSREPAAHMAALLVAAVTIAGADVAWVLGAPPWQVAWGWAAGLVLTIAAERLELARLARPPAWARNLFLALVAWVVGAAVVQAVVPSLGRPLLAVGLLALTGWLLRFDLGLRSFGRPGLPRFVATCLLIGYGWLAFAALLLLAGGTRVAGPVYDAQLHAVFVGFVFSMILGHAPVVFPAVLRVPVPLRSVSWVPLWLLHASLIVRVVGDLVGGPPVGGVSLRALGGAVNVVAILLFLLTTAGSAAWAVMGRERAGER